MKPVYYAIVILVFLAACSQQPSEEITMEGMPCHTMPDGSLMGDCDVGPEAGHMNGQGGHMGGADMTDAADSGSFLPSDEGVGAVPTRIIEVENGDVVELFAVPVRKTVGNESFVLYGYNGMIPGPVLKARQGTTFTVNFTNKIPHNTTVHWHGLRHDNADDGVPFVTQPPVGFGESYSYSISVPDNGLYWYHPHVREDLQQDLGLSGAIMVVPESDEYGAVNREEVLVLDDILVRDGSIVPYGSGETANFALMGRFGNVMLVNGMTDYVLDVKRGEIVRFYIANVANARPFNLSIPGARMKLVGSDLGLYEREGYVENVIISPAERYILEVLFENPGEHHLINKNPHAQYDLVTIKVGDEPVDENLAGSFNRLRTIETVAEDIARFSDEFERSPDAILRLTLDMHGMQMGGMMMHGDESIEWEDEMGPMNEAHTSEIVTWIIEDSGSGMRNMEGSLEARVGDVMKIRLWNDPSSMHPMQHPIHLHGQRFLVTHIDGVATDNKVWKDTVLVPTGSTVDILVDVTNPGEWMLHCHIAEHLSAGMMTSIEVRE